MKIRETSKKKACKVFVKNKNETYETIEALCGNFLPVPQIWVISILTHIMLSYSDGKLTEMPEQTKIMKSTLNKKN